nr:MerR family DNA-binding transcriptional regulator [Paraburkholderia humisilvae]
MEQRLVKIGEAAQMSSVAVSALRKWEGTGELLSARKTAGGTRYYAMSDLAESAMRMRPRSAMPAFPGTTSRKILSASTRCWKATARLKAGAAR